MAGEILHFADFELDRDAYELRRYGRRVPLERIPLDVLFLLIERPGRLVTRQEIIERVWGKGVFVDNEGAINTAVRKLRRALKDAPQTPHFVVTVPTKGYRFVGAVELTAPNRIEVPTISGAPAGRDGEADQLIVGREEELARIGQFFAKASEGIRQVVFVTGEPGIGKTTFVRSFLGQLARDGIARIGHGQCIEQYGAGEPYMPVLEALTRLGHGDGGERLVEILRKWAPSWLEQMPSLWGEADRYAPNAAMQAVTQKRMLRAMAEALEALARETPVVLLLEDLHWSDFSTLELISAIARRSEAARLLILGTYRPVEMLASEHPLRMVKHELDLHLLCKELPLKLLGAKDVADYLGHRFADSENAKAFSALARSIHQRTEGNPLFIVNVVDYLAAQGPPLEPSRIKAPRNIRHMIERNLERLDPDQQRMLEAASVAGAEFSAATVAAACERTVLDVEACCTGLSRRAQFVRSDGVSAWPDGTITSNFCFHHALYREVLYRRVPAGHRGELHRRIAKRQEEAHAEGPAEVAAELAYHYTRCGDNAKALKYLALAGEHAMACHAYGEAEQHYRNALSVLIMLDKTSERDRRELALQMALGGVMTTTRGYSAAETTQTYMRARNLAAEIGDTELLQVLRGLRASAATRGEVRAALVLADQMLACARAIGSDSALVTAHNARGNVRHSMGDLLGARSDFSTAIAHYRAEDFRSVPNDLGVSSLIWAGLNDWSLGFPASALNKAHEALELAERQSNPFVVSAALSLGGWVHILRRDYRSALEAGAKAVSLSAASGFPVWEALGRINSAWARAHLGEIAGTLESINEALTDLDAINFYVSRAAWMGMLCETQALSGMVDDASITIGRALQINFDEMIYRPELLRLRGVLHLWRGGGAKRRIELAERDFREAINLAGSMSAKSYELRATTSLACLLNSLGRSEEASVMLAEIYNWFTEGFDTADLKDAKTLLDELGT